MTTERSEVSALPDGVLSPAELVGRWTILRSKTNHERSLAEILAAAGVGYFLPLNTVVYRDACDKRRSKRVPLFPGYLFLCCDPVTFYDVLAVCREHVCGEPIRVVDQSRLTRELVNVNLALAAGSVDPYPHATVGSRCRVVDGPFRGLEGEVEYRDNRNMLVLRVSTLGCVALEIDLEHVEAA